MTIIKIIKKHFENFSMDPLYEGASNFSTDPVFEDASFIVLSKFSKFLLSNKEDKMALIGFKNLMSELVDKNMVYEIDEIVANLYDNDKQFIMNISNSLTPKVSIWVNEVIALWESPAGTES